MTLEIIGIMATLIVSVLDLIANMFALIMAGSCRSKCCNGCCDWAHEEAGDKLDVEMNEVCRKCSSDRISQKEVQIEN
jgi:hypothetical protein